jgi:hypothetical protein
VLVAFREGDRGTVFGRRRWRTPWSSGTTGEPWSPGVVRTTWAPKSTKPSWAEPSSPAAEPAVHSGDQPSGTTAAAEAPAEVTANAVSTRTRLIRIPAWSGVERTGDAGPVAGGAEPTRRRFRSAVAVREAPSVDAPPWEQAGDDRQGRTALAVLAAVVVCALLGGLAAFAVTLGGRTPVSPGPAASITPGVTPPGVGQAGTKVSGAGSKHVARGRVARGHGDSGHSDSGRGGGAPVPTPTTGTARRVTGKPAAAPASAEGARRRGDGSKRKPQPKRAVQHRPDRHPVGSAPDDVNGLAAR